MNRNTPDQDTPDRATTARVAHAFDRRAAALTLPPPDLAHLRELARQRPAAPTPGRRPLVVRGIAAAGAAAVLAAGVYAVQAGGAPAGGPTTTVSAAPDLSGGAPVLLRRIADGAATAPVTVPRSDQFVYTELVGEGVPKGSPEGYTGPPQRLGSEVWTAQAAGVDSLVIYGNGERVPVSSRIEGDPGTLSEMPTYADLAALPTDPAPLRTYLAAQFGGVFDGAQLLLQGNLVPPALAAGLYRVLADEPGLAVDPNAVDASGRPGVGITATGRGGVRNELIFDGTSLQLIGTRQFDGTGGLIGSVAVVDRAVVDAAGTRPG